MKERNRWDRFKNSRFCAVYGCFNRVRRGRAFFVFPTQEDVRQAWIVAVGREGFVPTEFSRVCSEHFKKKDFAYQGKFKSGRMRLKKAAVPTVFKYCYERPFPRYSEKVKINRLARAKAGAQAGENTSNPSSSLPYFQYEGLQNGVGVTEPPLVKQEVLSEDESPSENATSHSQVAFIPLKELITKLRSKNVPAPQQTSPSVKVEPEDSEQVLDSFSPVITNVRPVKPDPDSPNHQSPSVDPPSNEEFDSFVASSLVDCQLGDDDDDSSPTAADVRATENGSSLRGDDAHSSSSLLTGDEIDLCDKCGSYARKVDPATGPPAETNVRHPHQCSSGRKRKACLSCQVVCCDNPMCSMSAMKDSLVVKKSRSEDDSSLEGRRLAKFQAYGQLLAVRLCRLPSKTSLLVQNVIEELIFNAEDGQYDGCSSTKGLLKKETAGRPYKQRGGFDGYDS